MNLTYRLCKTLIEKGNYTSKDDMQIKLDVFFANNRINENEYEELTGILNEKAIN